MPITVPGQGPSVPMQEFLRWYDEAVAGGESEPEKMALATATPDGRPSVRYVLFRGLARGDQALRFFTNYESRKSGELDANPHAATVFYWPLTGRQVRFEGNIDRLDPAESDAYFAARPRGHRLAACASPQSRPIAHADLLARYAALEKEFADGRPIPRPANWGGWALVPDRIELWQRQENRLHRRVAWTREPAGEDARGAGGTGPLTSASGWRSEPLGP
jgi:pyridoxamine 5'-phosphate oxidase